jgi:NADPH-dependent curcumin reductase CurA
MTKDFILVVNKRQLDNIHEGLRELKRAVIDTQYECVSAEQIDTCVKKKLSIEETTTQLCYCVTRFNGKPGQIALYNSAWYEIIQRRITSENIIEYELYTVDGWVPAFKISAIEDRQQIFLKPPED